MKRQTKQAAAVDAVAEAKRRILETLERMPWTTGKRPPFVPADVRRESGLPKALFDRAVVELLQARTVYCAPHDHPFRLSAEERAELVEGDRGTFYCSISDRRPARPLPAEAIPDC